MPMNYVWIIAILVVAALVFALYAGNTRKKP
jgi:hypothetical protein